MASGAKARGVPAHRFSPSGCLPGSSGECSKRPVVASWFAQTRASAARLAFHASGGTPAATRASLCAASRRWLKSARKVVPPVSSGLHSSRTTGRIFLDSTQRLFGDACVRPLCLAPCYDLWLTARLRQSMSGGGNDRDFIAHLRRREQALRESER